MTHISVYVMWIIIDVISFLLIGLSKYMIPIYILFMISGFGINIMLLINTLKKIERQKLKGSDISLNRSDSYSPLVIKYEINPFTIDIDRIHTIEKISFYLNLIHIVTMTIMWVLSWSYSKFFMFPWNLIAYIIYYETYKCEDNDSILSKISNIIPEQIIQFVTCNCKTK